MGRVAVSGSGSGWWVIQSFCWSYWRLSRFLDSPVKSEIIAGETPWPEDYEVVQNMVSGTVVGVEKTEGGGEVSHQQGRPTGRRHEG